MQEEVQEDVLGAGCTKEAMVTKRTKTYSPSLRCVPYKGIPSAELEGLQVSRVCQTLGIDANVHGEFENTHPPQEEEAAVQAVPRPPYEVKPEEEVAGGSLHAAPARGRAGTLVTRERSRGASSAPRLREKNRKES